MDKPLNNPLLRTRIPVNGLGRNSATRLRVKRVDSQSTPAIPRPDYPHRCQFAVECQQALLMSRDEQVLLLEYMMRDEDEE